MLGSSPVIRTLDAEILLPIRRKSRGVDRFPFGAWSRSEYSFASWSTLIFMMATTPTLLTLCGRRRWPFWHLPAPPIPPPPPHPSTPPLPRQLRHPLWSMQMVILASTRLSHTHTPSSPWPDNDFPDHLLASLDAHPGAVPSSNT